MPHPRVRGLAAVLAIAGTLLGHNPLWMVLTWLLVLMPAALLSGSLRSHVGFAAVVVAPVAIAVFLVWGLLIAAPPGQEIGSDPHGGLRFAAVVVLRLLLLGGIIQLTFLTIPPEQLPFTLSRWGVRGDAAIVTLGVFALLPELRLRADQVLTARQARGLVPNRSFVARMYQLPFLLRPLFAWALRSAIQRADSWHQRGMLSRIDNLTQFPHLGSYWFDALYLLLGALWFASNLAMTLC